MGLQREKRGAPKSRVDRSLPMNGGKLRACTPFFSVGLLQGRPIFVLKTSLVFGVGSRPVSVTRPGIACPGLPFHSCKQNFFLRVITSAHKWRSEDNLQRPVLSFCHMGPREA